MLQINSVKKNYFNYNISFNTNNLFYQKVVIYLNIISCNFFIVLCIVYCIVYTYAVYFYNMILYHLLL